MQEKLQQAADFGKQALYPPALAVAELEAVQLLGKNGLLGEMGYKAATFLGNQEQSMFVHLWNKGIEVNTLGELAVSATYDLLVMAGVDVALSIISKSVYSLSKEKLDLMPLYTRKMSELSVAEKTLRVSCDALIVSTAMSWFT